MTSYIGSFTGLSDTDGYQDVRSEMSQETFKYLKRNLKQATCPKELPYGCSFAEGHQTITNKKLRVGSGLTRKRGAPRPTTQLVGPGNHQQGNGDRSATKIGTKLRDGTRQVLRGSQRPTTELMTQAKYETGQTPWTRFDTTVERSRDKYAQSIHSTFDYISQYGNQKPLHTELFRRGGESTRLCDDQ